MAALIAAYYGCRPWWQAGLTALIGSLNSRSMLSLPPLAVLRAAG